jgi:hypothetical protein
MHRSFRFVSFAIVLLPFSIVGFGEGGSSSNDLLPAGAQSAVTAAIGHDDPAYRAHPGGGGFQVFNATQGFSGSFAPSGVSLRSAKLDWAIKLEGWGYATALHSARAVAPHSAVNRIE